jgi:hypothetical protein
MWVSISSQSSIVVIFFCYRYADTFLLRVENTTTQPYLQEDLGDQRGKQDSELGKVVSKY